METTKQLTDAQKSALELIGRLADEGKIEMSEAIQLIIAIYENEKEIVYIPYQTPYPNPYPWTIEPYPYKDEPYKTPYRDDTPWWEKNKIICDGDNANNAHVDPNRISPFTYTISGTNWDPMDWIKNTLIG